MFCPKCKTKLLSMGNGSFICPRCVPKEDAIKIPKQLTLPSIQEAPTDHPDNETGTSKILMEG